MIQNEIFKYIKWYEWYYQISNLWKVIKLDRYEEFITRYWKIASRFRKWWEIYTTKNKKKHTSYLWVWLWKDWKVKFHLLHRLIATHFIDNPENKKEVNHIDWNWMNNSIDNLEWCSRSENELHKYKVLKRDGSTKWKKLTEEHITKSKIKRLETLKNRSLLLFNEMKTLWLNISQFEKLKWFSRTCLQKQFKGWWFY